MRHGPSLPQGKHRRLAGRPAGLISPMSVTRIDWDNARLDVALTKAQVEHSPDVDTHKPVSRRHEAAYWVLRVPLLLGWSYLWGPAAYPRARATPPAASTEAMAESIGRESKDWHLRSTEAVTGCNIEANDGEIGHVDGFVVDGEEPGAIRYIEVATRNWWPGKKCWSPPPGLSE